MNTAVRNLELSKLLATVRSLPPLPHSISQLLSLDQNDRAFLERANQIISPDPALVAQVIMVANSALYKGQDAVDTIEKAIMRVGAKTTVSALVAAHLKRAFNPSQKHITALWLGNIYAGLFTRALAEERADLELAPETVYSYGLLHDVGRLVLMELCPETVVSILEKDPHPVFQLPQVEDDLLGFNHQTAGRLLANCWGFPFNMTLVVATHHLPQEARRGHPESVDRMIDLINLADCTCVPVRSAFSTATEPDGCVAKALEAPQCAHLMDRLRLNRKNVLDILGPVLGELGLHAEELGISLEETFHKLVA